MQFMVLLERNLASIQISEKILHSLTFDQFEKQ
jgi:hypothetical protein